MDRVVLVRRLGVACVALTALLMVVGAWVKATESGLSCPDWPACYGQWLPPFPSAENGGLDPAAPDVADEYTQAQILSEWGHRALVSLLLVPLAAFAVAAGRARTLRPLLRTLPPLAFVLYFAQAALGAVTVFTGNPAWATTAHLALALGFYSTLLVATVAAYLAPNAPPTPDEPQAPPGLVTPAPFAGYTWGDAPKDR